MIGIDPIDLIQSLVELKLAFNSRSSLTITFSRLEELTSHE